jgi:hypothetical protein
MVLVVPTPVIWAAWLALTVACGARAARTAASDDRAGDAEVAIEVENHNFSDIVIYLVRGGQTQRLGLVTGLSTAHYVVPYRRLGATGDARLRAYPIGGPSAFTSEDLNVQPGQWVKWTLEADLSRSFLGVY